MLCGGTVMPLSALPSSGGPLVTSVSTDTCASAAWLPVFARYSSIVPGRRLAGPDEPEAGAGRAALRGDQAAGTRLLDLQALGHGTLSPRPQRRRGPRCVRDAADSSPAARPARPASAGPPRLMPVICRRPGRVSVATTGPGVALPPGVSRVTHGAARRRRGGHGGHRDGGRLSARPSRPPGRLARRSRRRHGWTRRFGRAACRAAASRMTTARREVDPGQRQHDEHGERPGGRTASGSPRLSFAVIARARASPGQACRHGPASRDAPRRLAAAPPARRLRRPIARAGQSCGQPALRR